MDGPSSVIEQPKFDFCFFQVRGQGGKRNFDLKARQISAGFLVVEEKEAKGLGAAWLLDGIAVSFFGMEQWNHPLIHA